MVIGIIAVLISILLPVLSTAREAANRAACLSNLHQINVILVMYANGNNGKIPLGFNVSGGVVAYGNCNWFSRKASAADADTDQNPRKSRLIGLGLLFLAKILKEDNGRVMYCPSVSQTDFYYSYNTSNNPWPPSAGNTRTPYSARPAINSDPSTLSHRPEQSVAWLSSGSFHPAKVVWADPLSVGDPTNPSARADMFHLSKMKGRAMVCDINTIDPNAAASKDRVKNVHKKGINVLYANGAAKWVPRSAFEDQLNDYLTRGTSPYFNNVRKEMLIYDRIWNNLDAEGQLYPGVPQNVQ